MLTISQEADLFDLVFSTAKWISIALIIISLFNTQKINHHD